MNKILDRRVRLGIMSVLMVNDTIDFNALKDLLGAVDSNLASHFKSLEKDEVIEVRKQFVGRRPNMRYMLIAQGRGLFEQHIDALDKPLKR